MIGFQALDLGLMAGLADVVVVGRATMSRSFSQRQCLVQAQAFPPDFLFQVTGSLLSKL